MTATIVGAGLAGLLAANTAFQDSEIIERQSKEDFKKHTALLRFRSSAVGDAVGIEFKKVTVHKGIWFDSQYYDKPSIRFANMYSQKTNGAIQDRSIWNLDTAQRWIAPDDFHETLMLRCKDRIKWNCDFRDLFSNDPSCGKFISTMPIPVLIKQLGFPDCKVVFPSRPIFVSRFRIPNCDVHQTIYFPCGSIGVYRASITGDMLTLESSEDLIFAGDIKHVCRAFHLNEDRLIEIDRASQQMGKILPIDDDWRKNFLFEMTHFYSIYSLGRFATWRQILLDDVLKDIFVIKKMMNGSSYERVKINSK